MQLARRAALQASRQLLRQQPRRFASHEHVQTSHAAPRPVKESFGFGTYLALGLIPLSYVLYTASRPGADGKEPWLTRVIGYYTNWEAEWRRRNELQTAAVEQAAADRHLFLGSQPKQNYDLRFSEVFNVGSPYNVPAGHYANVDTVIAKYHEDNRREEAERAIRMEARRQREQTPQKSLREKRLEHESRDVNV